MAAMNIWLEMARSQFQAGDLDAALGSIDRSLQMESTADAWALKEQILTEKVTRGERAIDKAIEVVDEGDKSLEAGREYANPDWESEVEFLLVDHEWETFVGFSSEERLSKTERLKVLSQDAPTQDWKADIWRQIGRLLHAEGDSQNSRDFYFQALIAYEKAIEIKPAYNEAWYNHGRLLSDLGRNEEAVASYIKTIEFKPKSYNSWCSHGHSLLSLGRYKEALESYNKAIEFKSNHCEIWHGLGAVLYRLGEFKAARTAYEKAIKIKPTNPSFWYGRGTASYDLGEYECAIKDYKEAITLDLKNYEAWSAQGTSFHRLSQYKQSMEAYDQAIKIKPNRYEAWNGRGEVLYDLEQYKEAILSYEKAIEINPNLDGALSDLGRTLSLLGQYEKAILSFDKAIEINPNSHTTWHSRGLALYRLKRYEDAIVSYEKAIEIKPDFEMAWHDRGSMLRLFGREEDAIVSYEKAIEIKLDFDMAWHSRSQSSAYYCIEPPQELPAHLNQKPVNLHHEYPDLSRRGYTGVVASLTIGLSFCPAETHPLSHGYLQRELGDAHWKYADRTSPRPKWREALTHYEYSEKVLTIADHPEERLQTLQRLVRVHFALKTNAETIAALIRQGAELRDRILTQAQSPQQRDRLYRTLPNFNEFTVDLHHRQGDPIRAIETAEADKNGLMQFLPSNETPNYHQMRQWIAHRTIVYWHFSANALTTFILTAERDRPIVLSQPDPETALKQRNELETWIENWNKNYNTHLETAKKENDNTEKTRSEWKNTLETELEKLAIILDIPTLITHLTHTKPLILIPHRDLHRLPLPSFFPRHLTTTLPSIQLGRNLRPTEPLTPHTHLLNISAPSHNDTSPLPEASLESIALGRLLTAQNIPVQTIANCNLPHLQTALPNHHTHLHFNGHAYYNDQNPTQSALALEGTDRLTVNDLRSIDLQHYRLITLASCETALTGNQTITAEYVGLVSAFLSHRIPHILSTLWTVQSNASALLILQFYRQLLKGNSPAQALRHSQRWLRTLTNRKLDRLYRTVLHKLPNTDYDLRPVLKTERHKLSTIDPNQMPYRHPYFWAAFTLAGHH